MMTLEQRARSAAAAVHASTAAYVPRSGPADFARRQARQRAGLVAAAGLAVFAALIAGTWLTGPTIDEVAGSPEPTIPDIEQPSDPPPVSIVPGPIDEAPPPIEKPPVEETPQLPPEPDPGTPALPPITEPSPTTLPPETTTTVPPDTTPPALAITSPEEGAVFDHKTIRFRGTTEPGAKVTAGTYKAEVDDQGNWSIVLILFEGRNRARFKATDAAGNESTASITVYFEKPKEEPPPGVDFTAHATYGSCSFDPPYDVYYGTAQPETKVTITSEYGGGNVYADAEGRWELKVYFPEAPPEVVFLVTVKDALGNKKTFEFVSLVGV